MTQLQIGIPKGSLQEPTVRLFAKAGYDIHIPARSYHLYINDEQMGGMLLRPQDMALYVERGVLDAGFAGKDWVIECGADVHTAAELEYSRASNRRARWVLAVPHDSPIQKASDLQGKTIYTEIVRTVQKWLAERRIEADVQFSHGATEAKVPHLGDAIVELTETGSSIRANNLRIVDVLMTSAVVFVVNRASWTDAWKREKIEDLLTLLQGTLSAQGKVGLKLNVPSDRLEAILKVLPAMKEPTISPLTNSDWVAVETIVDQPAARELIPLLRRAGGQDFIEYPLNKVIP